MDMLYLFRFSFSVGHDKPLRRVCLFAPDYGGAYAIFRANFGPKLGSATIVRPATDLEMNDLNFTGSPHPRFPHRWLDELQDDGVVVNDPLLLQEYGLSELVMTLTRGTLIVNKIVASEQRKGLGTRFMTDLVGAADRNGWIVALTPDASYGATSLNRLKRFYKRFGLKENRGRYADLLINESMVRYPQS